MGRAILSRGRQKPPEIVTPQKAIEPAPAIAYNTSKRNERRAEHGTAKRAIKKMGAGMGKLTEAAIKAMQPGERPYKKADGGGLYIAVYPDGATRWRHGGAFRK